MCLARRFSLASAWKLKSDEQQSTVAERPLLPLCMLTRLTGSWSWLRFAVPSRIAHPGGGCRRYDCEVPQRSWFVALIRAQTLRVKLLFPAYRTGRICSNIRNNGSRIRAEPSNNNKAAGRGQVFWGEIRIRRGISCAC